MFLVFFFFFQFLYPMLGDINSPMYCMIFKPTPNVIFLFRLYYWNKIVDLTETIVFALRKKDNQITFLHVIHHTLVIYLARLFFLNIRGK